MSILLEQIQYLEYLQLGSFMAVKWQGFLYQQLNIGEEKKVNPLFFRKYILFQFDCHGRDRMVVGFMTTYAISAYHH